MLSRFFVPKGYKVGLLATLACLLLYLVGIPFFRIMELKAFDYHLLSRGAVTPGPEVVIVAIDERSLDRLGRWPWPRTRIAALVDALKRYQAKVIAFDIVFSESDRGSNDVELASALRRNSSVILGYFFLTSRDEMKYVQEAPKPAASALSGSDGAYIVRRLDGGRSEPILLTAVGVKENIPILTQAAHGSGYFNIVPDPDGTIRWAPLAIRYEGNTFAGLSLQAVRKYLNSPPMILNTAEYGVDSIQVGGLRIPTDEEGRLLINFRGPQKTFPHYSFSDVVDGVVPADALRDKIVLVGATATGIYDMRVTPFSGTYPATEIHANIIDTILHQDFIHRPAWIFVFDAAAIVSLGVFLSILIPRIRAVYSAVAAAALLLGYVLLNQYLFTRLGLWLTAIYPVFTIAFVSACVMTFQFMTEERKRREIREAFSHYVSPSLVQELTKNPERLALGGEEARLTVLFADIRDFTRVAEGLSPPVLVKLMNDYLTPMTEVILRSGGTVDKYMGDAIMAFWGAPVWLEDHPVRACRAALGMLDRLSELQVLWEKAGIPRLDIGIGLSTGRVTVGNMGSATRFDYTVMGDTVNLGSRLEALNKEYGTRIIVPKYTYEDVKEEFILRPLDVVRVKGKDRPIKIYELMGERSDGTGLREVSELFEAGLNGYGERDWDKAEESFRKVLRLRPDDGPSQVFLTRIDSLRAAGPPEDWDGVFTAMAK
jgi:adenylate cyclase